MWSEEWAHLGILKCDSREKWINAGHLDTHELYKEEMARTTHLRRQEPTDFVYSKRDFVNKSHFTEVQIHPKNRQEGQSSWEFQYNFLTWIHNFANTKRQHSSGPKHACF